MDFSDVTDIPSSFVMVCLSILLWRRRKSRCWGGRPINRLRRQQCEYWNLFQELKKKDTEPFFKYTRMTLTQFNELLIMIKPFLIRRVSSTTIEHEERLALTLRYLATGDSIQSIAWGFRVGRSTAGQVIGDTCNVIWKVLNPLYLPQLTTNDWHKISSKFQDIWNFPHCIGAIDEKHISIEAPPNSGSLYYNYERFNSIVLLATCDAHYRFTMVNIGGLGSDCDGVIFARSNFGKALLENKLNLPSPTLFPNTDITLPYCLVGDEAFPLKKFLMRPYPGRQLSLEKRIFNYRLSRARRTVENYFGIFTSRWRVFRKTFSLNPDKVDEIVLAAACLHNFIMTKETEIEKKNRYYCPLNFIAVENTETGEFQPGSWRQEERNVQRNIVLHQSNRATQYALEIRDSIANFCAYICPLPWQMDHVNRGQTML